MRKFIATIALASILASSNLVSAQEWLAPTGYPVAGYPVPQQAPDRPVLRRLLIGGALVGIGFAIGRVTAPKPYYGPQYGYAPSGGYGPSPGFGYPAGPAWAHHGRHF